MPKYILAIVILCGLTLFVARQDERATQESAQKAAQLRNGAVSAEPNEQHPQENVEDTERHTPGWYGFFRWPNGTTTWAIILTLLAIVEQTMHTAKSAKATESSAKATRDSIDVQKAAYRQWITIENWRADDVPALCEGAEAALVNIRFDILNPTKFPLTIRRIITQRQDPTPLPPRTLHTTKRLAPDERYLLKATVCFERKVMEPYLEGRGALFAMVGVSVGFEDVLGDGQEDTFGRYCWLGKSGDNSFDPYEPGVIPETEFKGDGKQAN